MEGSPRPLRGHSVGVPGALGTCPAIHWHDHLCVTWLEKLWGCSSLVTSLAKPTSGPCPEGPPPTARLPSEASGPSEPSPPCLPLLASKQTAASGSSWVFSIKTAKYYIDNPRDSTRKLLELINEYSKVSGYKINTQKSLTFLYTNNEKIEREIKETIPFTIAMKRLKYLGIYIPKETKDLYIENYKTLVKEIKEDTNREIYHVHGSEESIY